MGSAKKKHRSTVVAHDCLNCREPLTGSYCASCGQSAHEGREPGIGHFLHDLVHEFLHVDGKLVKTVRALLLKPGQLTSEYWNGRIASWIRPIRLFLVAVAIHWLASTGVGPLNLQVLLERDRSGELAVSITSEPGRMSGRDGRVRATPEEHALFLEKFRHRYAQIRYSSVLLFAAVSWLIYRRVQKYYVNHLIGALHFYAFWYLIAIGGNELMKLDPRLGGAGMIVSAIYLAFALKRLYGQSWTATVLRTMGLIVSLGLIELVLGAIAGSVAVRDGGLNAP